MKRLIPLLIGLLVLLGPAPAARAEGENYATSSAVLTVLNRADAALAGADQDDIFVTFFATALGSWSRDALTPVVRALDVNVRVIDYQRDVLHQTACFRTDVALIEDKMEQTRLKLNTSLQDRNILAIIRLTDLYDYLVERKDLLLQGGIDPTLEDDGALAERMAGPASWDEHAAWQEWSGTTPEDEEPEEDEDGNERLPFCYFHTDFLPPSVAGYGCDVEAMSAIIDGLPDGHDEIKEMVEIERDGILLVQAAVMSFLSGAQTFSELATSVDNVTLGDNPSDTAVGTRTHRQREGCNPEGVPPGAVVRALRGPFRLNENESYLLLEFEDLKRRQELDRPYPKNYAPADDEIPDEEDDAAAVTPESDDRWSLFWIQSIMDHVRSSIATGGREQAKLDVSIFAMAGDSTAQMEESMENFTEAVGRLSHLATVVDGGLRGFVRDFTYFLLRTCMERECQQRLEHVARITLTDECFPYVSGAYLSDTCINSRAKKCAEKAGLPPPPEPNCPN